MWTTEFEAVIKLADTTADVNVFFVWEWERDLDRSTDYEGLHYRARSFSKTTRATNLAKRSPTSFATTSGLSRISTIPRERWLMYGITDDRGKFLPGDILTINQNDIS